MLLPIKAGLQPKSFPYYLKKIWFDDKHVIKYTCKGLVGSQSLIDSRGFQVLLYSVPIDIRTLACYYFHTHFSDRMPEIHLLKLGKSSFQRTFSME